MVSFRRAQSKIIDFVVDRLFVKGHEGAATFAKIGAGKTVAALEIFNQLRAVGECKRALIVAPLRPLSRTWPDEISQWAYDYKHTKVNGATPNPTNHDIVFCSPDSLHKVIPLAQQKCFDLLIVDESQRFQNFTTLRMKNIKKILPHINKRVILTATPAANRLTQLFSQIYIVDDGESLGKNISVCRARFCDKGGFKGREHIFRKDKEQEILDLIAPLSIHIDETDIDFDYPELIVNNLVCPMDSATKLQQITLKEQLFVALQNGEQITVGSAGAAYNSLKQLANGFLYGENKEIKPLHTAKLDALRSIANESSGPVLIFYWYAADLERIVTELGAANCAVPNKKSDKLANKEIDIWMNGKKQFLIAQIASMGEGLNLQASNHDCLVMFGVPDSGTTYLQSIGRLQRPGGAKHIFLHRIIMENSIEQTMIDRLDGRIATQECFLNRLKEWSRA